MHGSNFTRPSHPSVAAALLLLSAACSGNFSPASLVSRSRVLAARTTVGEDEKNATPRPGEVAKVDVLVVNKAETGPMTWALGVCAQGPAEASSLFCGGDVFATKVQSDSTTDLPSIEFEAPRGTERVLLLGVVCANGSLDPKGGIVEGACAGKKVEETKFTWTIPIIASANQVNHNPSLEDAPVEFEGEVMTAKTADYATSCKDQQILRAVPKAEKAVIRVRPNPMNLEQYTDDAGAAQVERHRMTHYSNAGELERDFSIFDAENAEVEVEWAWPTPDEIPAEGLLVRFDFVLRDLRGGADWTSRFLCVTRGNE